mmetsp:Transcript_10530/g.33512  ORF Transcript_10530/g.33512 Transcript_10530/m.33512 type:complete len:349 (-) Transcript_10530:380-1426(-)
MRATGAAAAAPMRSVRATALICLVSCVVGDELQPAQSVYKEQLFERRFEEGQVRLEEELAKNPAFNIPDLLPTDFYKDGGDIGYTQSLLIDPCQGLDPTCCSGRYGMPEYKARPMDAVSLSADGSVLDSSRSRWPDDLQFYDETCVEDGDDLIKVTYTLSPSGAISETREVVSATDGNSPCLEHHFGRAPPHVSPPSSASRRSHRAGTTTRRWSPTRTAWTAPATDCPRASPSATRRTPSSPSAATSTPTRVTAERSSSCTHQVRSAASSAGASAAAASAASAAASPARLRWVHSPHTSHLRLFMLLRRRNGDCRATSTGRVHERLPDNDAESDLPLQQLARGLPRRL